MAKSVEDAARVFDVMVGFDRDDPLTYAYSVARAPSSYLRGLRPDGLHGTRIGVLRTAFGSDDDDDKSRPVNEVISTALTELQAGDAELVDVAVDELSDWIGRTSLYTIKSKYDIDQWLATLPDPPAKSVDEIMASGRYHKNSIFWKR